MRVVAEVLLHPAPQSFPPGTTVKVFARAQLDVPSSGQPGGTILSEPVVATNGSLAVSGLEEGHRYLGWANTNGVDCYLRFEAGGNPGGLVVSGEDGTVGGPGGTPLAPSVVSGSTKQVDITKPPYNVAAGVTAEPELRIQEAVIAANADFLAGKGTTEVYVPPGAYSGMKLHVIPGQTSQAACLYMMNGVSLKFAQGAKFVYAPFEKLPAGCTGAQFIGNLHPFTNAGNTTEKIVLEGVDIDCNGANQGEVSLKMGLFFGAAKGCARIRCRVSNLYGTASSGNGETFHYEDNNCLNCTSFFCEADGSAIANTATGFSADNSVDSAWVNCYSHGMGFAQGFTHWQCSNLSYVACVTAKCGQSAFNSERSAHVTYTACIAGGSSAPVGNGNGTNPFFTSGYETLGNENGFRIQGSRHVTIDASCQSMFNTKWGVALTSDAATIVGMPELSGTTTVNSAEATSVTTAGLVPGMSVKGVGIPEGTVIEEVKATAILMTNKATTAETRTLTFDTFRSCWDVRVFGTHRLNTSNNIFVNNTAEALNGRQIDCVVYANTSDTSPDAMLLAAWAPLLLLENLGSGSGNRIQYKGSVAALSKVFRLLNQNTGREPLGLNAGDQVSTLGRARHARAVADAATTQETFDDIIYYTTLTGSHVVQLLKASQLADGTEIEVIDTGGNAGPTKKIEFAQGSGDPAIVLLAGQALTTAIETAKGFRRLRLLGGTWYCS